MSITEQFAPVLAQLNSDIAKNPTNQDLLNLRASIMNSISASSTQVSPAPAAPLLPGQMKGGKTKKQAPIQ